MRKFGKLTAVTVVLSFVPAVGQAWAAPVAEAILPARTLAVLGATAAVPAVAPAIAAPTAVALATPPASIRGTLEELRQSPLVLLPERPARAAAVAQPATGRGLSTAAKAAIWISAVTVAAVWGYKTFSVTRGTD